MLNFFLAASSASVDASSSSDESNTSDFASPSRCNSIENYDEKCLPPSLSSPNNSFSNEYSQQPNTTGQNQLNSFLNASAGPSLSRQQLLSGKLIIID